ncbi:MAG: LysM peptidoglycan-binding domain-containing protein [Thermoleophilia bacterium]
MYSQVEPKILRSMGVIALVAASMAAAIITFNSGILGGSSSSGSVEVLDSASGVPIESQVPQATTATTGTRSHMVADGDSFYTIARKYNVSISEIQQLNPNVDPQNLTTGLRISIP